MTPPARVLVVGFDAADRDVVLGLARDGRLPAVRSLLDRGLHAETENPVGLFVGSVWPSFYTGVSPDRHGRYCFGQIRPGTYEIHRVNPADVQHEPFWSALARAGRRTAVIDVPHTRPTGGLDGIHLVDWGRHDRNIGFCTWPDGLAAEVVERFGEHPVGRCDDYGRRAAFGELGDGLVEGIGRKAELAEFYLGQGDWDLFMVVFSESHCAGHQCWFLHDPDHPRHDPARAAGDPLVDVYEALDRALARLLEAVGDDTLVLLLLSHGMGPHYDATFMLGEMLGRIEDAGPGRRRGLVTRERARRAMRHAVRGARRRLGLPQDAFTYFVDGSRAFFPVPNNDVYGAVRVNVAAREPAGRVRPGQLDDVCGMLADELAEWVNLGTGEPLVQRVLRTADHYAGPATASMPDLLVEWDRRAPISAISHPRLGEIEKEYRGVRSGDHQPGGLLLARGPGVGAAGAHPPVRVVDVAPTICAALDVELDDSDGDAVPAIARPKPA